MWFGYAIRILRRCTIYFWCWGSCTLLWCAFLQYPLAAPRSIASFVPIAAVYYNPALPQTGLFCFSGERFSRSSLRYAGIAYSQHVHNHIVSGLLYRFGDALYREEELALAWNYPLSSHLHLALTHHAHQLSIKRYGHQLVGSWDIAAVWDHAPFRLAWLFRNLSGTDFGLAHDIPQLWRWGCGYQTGNIEFYVDIEQERNFDINLIPEFRLSFSEALAMQSFWESLTHLWCLGGTLQWNGLGVGYLVEIHPDLPLSQSFSLFWDW